MWRNKVVLAFLPAFLVLLAIASPMHAQEGPERRTYDEADAALNGQLYAAAAVGFDRFLQLYPQSPLAPQARFKLGCVHVLQGKPADAEKAFKQLVEHCFGSPWARLALRTSFSEEQLFNLANETRQRGCRTKLAADAGAAIELYQLFLERFPNTTRNRGEIFFKIGNYTEAQAAAKDTGWAKLAEITGGGMPIFREGMEELLQLTDVGEEGQLTFLDLSEHALPDFNDDLKARCLYLRGRCFTDLKNDAEAVIAYETVLKNHPASEHAAEAAFWLAEREIGLRHFEQARTALHDFAAKYPASRRAPQAREWAAWLDGADTAWQELARALVETSQRLTEGKGGIAFRVRWQSTDPGKVMEGRFAFQDAGHLCLSIGAPPLGLLLANNNLGSWYRPVGRPELLKVQQGLPLPIPHGVVNVDPATNGPNFNFQMGPGPIEASAPLVQVAPAVGPICIALMKASIHLRRVPGEGKKAVYCLERPRWHTFEPDRWDIVLDDAHHLRELRYTGFNHKGEKTVWELTDVKLGEPLAESEFDVPTAGVPVRGVESVNPMEVLGQLMQLGGTVWQTAKTQRQ